MGTIGIAAFLSAGLLLFASGSGVLLTFCVGCGIAIFEVVEMLVVGLDVWVYALHLGPQRGPSSPSLAGTANAGTLLGIPIPLWLQPFYFVYGTGASTVRPCNTRGGRGNAMSTPHPLPITRPLTFPWVLSGMARGLAKRNSPISPSRRINGDAPNTD